MSEAKIQHGHRDVNSDKAEAEAEAQIRISRCDAMRCAGVSRLRSVTTQDSLAQRRNG